MTQRRLPIRFVLTSGLAACAAACGSSVPEPRFSSQPPTAYSEVPYPPPPARTEFLPARPRADAVWVDGEWDWNGRRWGWRYGAWVVPSAGATLARWAIVRRSDGTLFFAPSVWRDSAGREAAPPTPLAVAGASEDTVVSPEGTQETTAPNTRK